MLLESMAQTKYSGEWYFDTLARSPLDGYSKLSFGSFSENIPLTDANEYFVSFEKFEQLEKFAQVVPKEKVRGIEFKKSIENFPADATKKILSQFPNLDIIQFSSGSLFKPFPEKNQAFPKYISELGQLKVLSFYFHVDFPLDDLAAYTKKMPQLEALFFIAVYDAVPADVLDHPSLTSILLTSTNFSGQELPKNPRIRNVGLLSSRKDRNINASMEQLKAFPNLQSLYLDHARFEDSGYFEQVKGIKKLEVKRLDSLINTDFYRELSSLQQLEKLDIFHDLQNNQNVGHIGKLSQLKQLSLSRINSLKEVDFLSGLKNLEELSLIENQLSMESFLFSELPRLKSLNISYCKELRLHPEAFDNPNLETLILTTNKLVRLPSLDFLPKLSYLDLSKNGLKSLDLQTLRLPELKTLEIRENALTSLSLDLSGLPKLTRLEAERNEIQKLLGPIPVQENLHTLNLSNNRLSNITLDLGNLKNLYRLDLNFNLLEQLPTGLKNLRELDVMFQGAKNPNEQNTVSTLKYLSSDFETHTQLERIILRGNKNLSLDQLWKCLANMPAGKAVFMDLSEVGKLELPDADFWQAIEWRGLNLQGNSIPRIPDGMNKTMSFSWMNLGKIEAFPGSPKNISFDNLTDYLMFLNVHGYPVSLDELSDSSYVQRIGVLMESYRYSGSPEMIISFYKRALSKNKALAEQTLQSYNLGNAAYALGDYTIALPIFLKELEKETQSSIRLINRIETLMKGLEDMYKSSNDYEKLGKLWIQTANSVGLKKYFLKASLFTHQEDPVKADSLGIIALKKYRGDIDSMIERNKQDLGDALDYLEAAIIIDSGEHINDALQLSKDWMTADENRQGIFNLLSGIIAINNGEAYNSLKPRPVKNWNFTMLRDWIALNVKPELKEELEQWVDLFQQSQ